MRMAWVFFMVALAGGCDKPEPDFWKVELVSPAGVVEDEWTIICHGLPRKVDLGGGKTGMKDPYDGETQPWERDIQAPSGWALRTIKINRFSSPPPKNPFPGKVD